MTLRIASASPVDVAAVAASLREATKLGGKVELVETSSLPNDGKVIDDVRDYAK